MRSTATGRRLPADADSRQIRSGPGAGWAARDARPCTWPAADPRDVLGPARMRERGSVLLARLPQQVPLAVADDRLGAGRPHVDADQETAGHVGYLAGKCCVLRCSVLQWRGFLRSEQHENTQHATHNTYYLCRTPRIHTALERPAGKEIR